MTGFERFKGGTRLEFVCGGRALARFRQQRDVIASAVRRLSVLPADLPGAIERLQDEMKDTEERRPRPAAAARALRGGGVRARGPPSVAGLRLVAERVDGWDAQGLKALATAHRRAAPACGRACSAAARRR